MSTIEAAADVSTDAAEVTEIVATEAVEPRKRYRAHLTLVAPLSPDRASRSTFVVIVTGILALALLVMLIINTSLAQGSFTVQALRAEYQALQEQEQVLLEEVAAASAPIALEYRARELGMVPSMTSVFISVPDGRVLGKPRPAPGSASQTTARITASASFTTDISALPMTIADARGYADPGQVRSALSGEDALWRELPPSSLMVPGQALLAQEESGPDAQLTAEPMEQ